LNYNRSLLFHGGDTGSTPVRDANIPKHLQDSAAYLAADAFVNGLFWTCGEPGRNILDSAMRLPLFVRPASTYISIVTLRWE